MDDGSRRFADTQLSTLGRLDYGGGGYALRTREQAGPNAGRQNRETAQPSYCFATKVLANKFNHLLP